MHRSMQINCIVSHFQVLFYARECTLLVRIQLSKKSASHPQCAFADSASTVMRGAMVSLTPCIARTCDRECDLQEYAEFQGVEDMIAKLNGVLAESEGFPQIPIAKKDCHTLVLPSNKRYKQYVICPEQDCECLVYMSDLNTSMVEAIGLHDHPWWRKRVEEFYSWHTKFVKPRMHGHGKKAVTPNGPLHLPRVLPREASPFLSIRQIVEIQQRKALHGKISDQLTLVTTTSSG